MTLRLEMLAVHLPSDRHVLHEARIDGFWLCAEIAAYEAVGVEKRLRSPRKA